LAPGIITGCGILEQKKLVMEILSSVLDGTMEYGINETLGVREGYIDFNFDDQNYRDSLPVEIRERFESFFDDLKAGNINYTVPAL
jgi:hypothetical protein